MTDLPFFQLVDGCVDEAALGAYNEIYKKNIDGMLVRGVVPVEVANRAVAILEHPGCPLEKFPMGSSFIGHCRGLGLDRSEGDLGLYFDVARRSIETMKSLAEFRALCEPVIRILEHLTANLPVLTPAGPDTRSYLPYNFRCFPPGGLIPPHIEMEQKGRESYRHLNSLLDEKTLISFFLTLQASEEGGELAIHDLHWNELGPENFDRGHTQLQPLLENRNSLIIKPDVGDLLIFNGGSFAHEVTPVLGRKNRWTLGGFLVPAVDQTKVFLWT